MMNRMMSAFVAVIALSCLITTEAASRSKLTITVSSPFPREIGYRLLKNKIAQLVTPCPLRITSGSRNMPLLRAVSNMRRPLARAILDHLVDEEFARKRRKSVVIDSLSFGVSQIRNAGFVGNRTVEVKLDHHMLLVATEKRANYSITLWNWKSKSSHKSCGFSYHY